MQAGKRKTLTLLLLGIWAVASAQAPPGEEQTPAAAVDGQALPCVPATDTPPAPAGKSDPLEGQPQGTGPTAAPCEEQAAEAEPAAEPAAEAPDETVAGPEATVEEDPGVEASADDVFTPGDEISEDYPVPLPADI
jgi:hypothetical protein